MRCPPPAAELSVSATDSLNRVIDGGYCIGCGACAALEGSPAQMAVTRLGTLQAVLPHRPPPCASAARAAAVCPFSEGAADENELARPLFADHCRYDEAVGYHLSTYAGYVLEDGFRDSGSSGGMGTWLQCELLNLGIADRVINVASRLPNSADRRLFEYRISSSRAEVRAGAKSKYYPIEFSTALGAVRRTPGRYVLVGLPCFIKAARLLCRQDAVLANRLQLFVGLVCGHLKSMRFAELMAWQMGVEPVSLSGFDFRKKLSDRPASHYGVEAIAQSGDRTTRVTRAAHDLAGTDWGHGFFKYKACDYCDDVFAETADVVVGDAWLPQFSHDSRGTNALVVRRPEVEEMICKAVAQGRVHLERLSVCETARSQAAGLRHRRDGLRYRIYLAQQRDEWYPPKRVSASSKHLTRRGRARQRLRERLRDMSHEAFADGLETGDLSSFLDTMRPLLDADWKLSVTLRERVLLKAKRTTLGLARSVRAALTRLVRVSYRP